MVDLSKQVALRGALSSCLALAGVSMLAGCPENTPPNDVATDTHHAEAATDVPIGTDVQEEDVQTQQADVQDVQDVVTPMDVQDVVTPTDAQDVQTDHADVQSPSDVIDANVCPTTNPFDPNTVWMAYNSVRVMRYDGTGVGSPADNNQVAIFIKGGNYIQPSMMAGDCVTRGRLSGDATINSSPTLDLGMLTVTQGTAINWTFTYNTTMMNYVSGAMPTTFFQPNQPITVTFAGGTAGSAGTTTLIHPPGPVRPDVDFIFPALHTGTAANITWTVPTTGVTPDLMAYVVLADQSNMFAHMTTCAVPACRGQVTIPAAIMAQYTGASASITVNAGFARQAFIEPTSTSVGARKVQVFAGDEYRATSSVVSP